MDVLARGPRLLASRSGRARHPAVVRAHARPLDDPARTVPGPRNTDVGLVAPHPHDAAQLWLDAQEAKHALSERTKTNVVCFHAGLRERLTITRDVFETLTQDLLERTKSTTESVVKQAKVDHTQIDRVILVGGSTRMPAVAEMLRGVTGKEPDRSISPDESVAHGAALYASPLAAQGESTDQTGFELINVNSHSLGIVTLDPQTHRQINVVLIPKNTPLPVQTSRTFRTAEPGQRTVQVTVVEGESRQPDQCVTLGQCVIRNLPEGLAQGTEFDFCSLGGQCDHVFQ